MTVSFWSLRLDLRVHRAERLDGDGELRVEPDLAWGHPEFLREDRGRSLSPRPDPQVFFTCAMVGMGGTAGGLPMLVPPAPDQRELSWRQVPAVPPSILARGGGARNRAGIAQSFGLQLGRIGCRNPGNPVRISVQLRCSFGPS